MYRISITSYAETATESQLLEAYDLYKHDRGSFYGFCEDNHINPDAEIVVNGVPVLAIEYMEYLMTVGA